MNTLIDAAKQALGALEAIRSEKMFVSVQLIAKNARYSLRQAIAEAEKESTLQEMSDIGQEIEQEPVAWISDSPTKGNGKQLHFTKADAWRWSSNITPLYTAPPKRKWFGLTDEEIDYLEDAIDPAMYRVFARRIEAKLREKNGG